MNYKFTNSVLDEKKYSFYDNSKDIYKSPVINRSKPFNHKLVNTNFNKNSHYSMTTTSPNNKRISHHRFNNSQLNVSYLSNKFTHKDHVFSDSVKNTIERYDFKTNFEILKNKINMLSNLKEKEIFKTAKKKDLSPPYRFSTDYDKFHDKTHSFIKNEVSNPKLNFYRHLDKSKDSGTYISLRMYTEDFTVNKRVSPIEKRELEIKKKDIQSSSDLSDFNVEEITDDLIKIQKDIKREYTLNHKIEKKLMFIDESYEKKERKQHIPIVSTPVKKAKVTPPKGNVFDSHEDKKISIPIQEKENAEVILRSQKLIRELSNSECITLYERDINPVNNRENTSVLKEAGLNYPPEESPRPNNLNMEMPMRIISKQSMAEEKEANKKVEDINKEREEINENNIIKAEKDESKKDNVILPFEKEETKNEETGTKVDKGINLKKEEIEKGVQTDIIQEDKFEEKKEDNKKELPIEENKENLIRETIDLEIQFTSINQTPECRKGIIGDKNDELSFNNNIADTEDKNEKNEDSDEELSELSQFLKEAGLLTITKNKKDKTENRTVEIDIQQTLPEKEATSNEKISISQSLNFEIPSKHSRTPINLKNELFKNNLTDCQDKAINLNDNISVNEIGNNSNMTNGSKKKVTFSDNKTVISYEAKRFGTICSPSTLNDKRKKEKKPKSILVKKTEEIERSHDLVKLNDFLFECEEEHFYPKENNSVKAFSLKKTETCNSNAIRVQNNLNNKHINRNKKIVHEIQERVKRGEPKMIKSSLIPKGPSTNPSRNVIKIDALKFDIDKPRSHSAFDEIKINDKIENRRNSDQEQIDLGSNIHRKSNSSNLATYSSFSGINLKKDLSVITDTSHESSSDKNKSNEYRNWSNKPTIKTQKI